MYHGLVFSIGLIFLLGLAFSGILRKLKIPSVTSYIFLGIIMGPLVTDIISPRLIDISALVSTLVLSIIAFSLGQNLTKSNFALMGKSIIYISLFQSIATAAFVGLGIYILMGDVLFALAVASIPAATSPTSVVMVVRDLNAKGKFSEMLMGTVALSDLWALILFGLILSVIGGPGTIGGKSIVISLGGGLFRIMAAVSLGIALGILMSFISGYITKASELLILTLGFILFATGASLFLELSPLLSSLAMSGTVSNINKEGFKFFNSLKALDSPLYLLFFVLAGAGLRIESFTRIGIVGGVYIVLRMTGKIVGGYFGGLAADIPSKMRKSIGAALMPQAGVSMGLAVIISSVYPEPAAGKLLLSIIVASTVVFEIFGPFLTRYALVKNSG